MNNHQGSDMTDPIKRFKDVEELTAAEHAERLRDPTKRFETIEYSSAVQEALIEAGLWDPDDLPPAAGPKPTND